MSAEQLSVWRIMDANHNRVAEGLRVVEEFLRFHVEDPHLAGLVKELRHELQQVMLEAAGPNIVIARDTRGDVGRDVTTRDEHTRPSLAALVSANWQRVQQGLRVLEEYSKLLPTQASLKFEQLRYRSYTLAKALQVTVAANECLVGCQVYVLLSCNPDAAAFEQLARELIAAEVDILQLRDKSATDRALFACGLKLREWTRGTKTLFIMNDRADLTVLTDADGLHVGQEELTVAQARKIIGPQRLIGVSTHNLQQAQDAVLAGADYIGCGPTFPSRTKNFPHFPGLDFLREVAAQISLPAFAIGGIDETNLPRVMQAGISRIAVTAAVTKSPAPGSAVRQLKQTLQATAAKS